MTRKLALLSVVLLGACVAAPVEVPTRAETLHYRVESKSRLPFARLASAAQKKADETCAARGKTARWAISSTSEGSPATRFVFVCE